MGHVPSSGACNNCPFIVDLETVKGAECLVAMALTQENIGNIDSPMFQKFYAARCEESVHHWFKACPERTVIPPPPSVESVYTEFVLEPSAHIAKIDGSPAAEFLPIPIVLLRSRRSLDKSISVQRITQDCDNFDIVGYFGCRHFDSDGGQQRLGTVGMFLTRAFHNEAKSVSIIEIACKCYAHFSTALGAVKVPWPRELTLATLDSNLPTLRLLQKLLRSMAPDLRDTVIAETEVRRDVSDARLHCTLRNAAAIAAFCDMMAERVTLVSNHHVLHTKPIEPTPVGSMHPVLDAIVSEAKAKWKDHNRPVAESNQPQVVIPSKKEKIKRGGSEESSRGSGIALATSPPLGTLPGNTSFGSNFQVQGVTGEIHARRLSKKERKRLRTDEVNRSPVPQSVIAFRVPLVLAEGTFFYYLQRGMWMASQWRAQDRYLVLAATQHPSTGLLAVQAMEGDACDLAVYGPYGHPARLRLDTPEFYIEPSAAIYMNPAEPTPQPPPAAQLVLPPVPVDRESEEGSIRAIFGTSATEDISNLWKVT